MITMMIIMMIMTMIPLNCALLGRAFSCALPCVPPSASPPPPRMCVCVFVRARAATLAATCIRLHSLAGGGAWGAGGALEGTLGAARGGGGLVLLRVAHAAHVALAATVHTQRTRTSTRSAHIHRGGWAAGVRGWIVRGRRVFQLAIPLAPARPTLLNAAQVASLGEDLVAARVANDRLSRALLASQTETKEAHAVRQLGTSVKKLVMQSCCERTRRTAVVIAPTFTFTFATQPLNHQTTQPPNHQTTQPPNHPTTKPPNH